MRTNTHPVCRDLPPSDAGGAGHHELMRGLSAGDLLRGLARPRGVQIRTAAIAVRPQVQVEDGEGLSAKAGSQTLQRGQILIHDFLRAEPALAHRVLLEAAHKLGEHAADAELG